MAAAKPNVVPRLVIIEGKDKGKVIALTDGTAVIGRTKGDVLVQDPRVSRSHLAIHYDSKTQKLTFTDLKSLNGTILNGKAAETGELRDGDKILLGNTLFDCQLGAPLDEETSVSKVRDQMAREKEERERSASAPAVSQPSKVEPQLTPLGEDSGEAEPTPPPVREPAPTRRRNAVTVAVEDEESPRSAVTLSGLRLTWSRLPSRLRNLTLGVVLILGLLYYANMGRIPTATNSDFEMAAAPIRKLLSQGRNDDALKAALELQGKFPDVADSHMLVGNLMWHLGKAEGAVDAYEKAKAINPDDPLVHTNLIRIFLRSGLAAKAEPEMAYLDQMIQTKKHSKTLFVEVAKLLIEFRDQIQIPAEKAMIIAKALQSQYAPESSIGHKLESQVHLREARKADALKALEAGLMVEPNDVWILESIAFLRLELKDFAGATATVEKWIQRVPASTTPLLFMGYLKMRAEDYQGAVPYLQRVIQAGNNNLQISDVREAVDLLGQIAFNQRSFKEASEFFRQSCQAGYQAACEHEANLRKTLESAPRDPVAEPATPPDEPPASPGQN